MAGSGAWTLFCRKCGAAELLKERSSDLSICVWGRLIGHGFTEKARDWIRETRFRIQVTVEATGLDKVSSHTEILGGGKVGTLRIPLPI